MNNTNIFLLSTDNVIAIYGNLLTSINTIWYIYVFILLATIGWILARATDFLRSQKIILTIIFAIFNIVVLFYFLDAYSDLESVRLELLQHKEKSNLEIVKDGISDNLLSFEPLVRFCYVFLFVFCFGGFVLFLIWSKNLWPNNNKSS